MRNIKLEKFTPHQNSAGTPTPRALAFGAGFTSAVTIFVMLLMVAMPLLAGAQFRTPTAPGTDPLPTQNTATEIILRVIQILLAIAGLVAVIFLIVGGFRYITAGGNEETAEAGKKTITNAIIGIVIIILAFVIVRVISNALIGGAGEV